MYAEPRKLEAKDRARLEQFLQVHWGAPEIITRGRLYRVSELDGFYFEVNAEIDALLTYRIEGGKLEITSLDALTPAKGAGTALLSHCVQFARQKKLRRVWLVTSNDNVEALRFYQKRGFSLVAVHRGAINQARKIKPAIPLVGSHGIHIQDEIELEMLIAED